MKKRLITLVMALVMVVSICCSCAAASDSKTTTNKDSDVSTTESTKESPTITDNDTGTDEISDSARQDSSTPAETETADTTETTNPILSDENIDKLYALVAYNINHEYLEPNDMAKVQFKWFTSYNEWLLLTESLVISFADQDSTMTDGLSYIGNSGEYLENTDNLELIAIVFTSLYNSYKSYFSNYNLSDFEFLDWQTPLVKNVTFSADQLKLGEEVAQEISELETAE